MISPIRLRTCGGFRAVKFDFEGIKLNFKIPYFAILGKEVLRRVWQVRQNSVAAAAGLCLQGVFLTRNIVDTAVGAAGNFQFSADEPPRWGTAFRWAGVIAVSRNVPLRRRSAVAEQIFRCWRLSERKCERLFPPPHYGIPLFHRAYRICAQHVSGSRFSVRS